MDEELRKFLSALVRNGGASSRSSLPIADRKQDKARTKAKRLGYAKYMAGQWSISDAGRAAISAMEK